MRPGRALVVSGALALACIALACGESGASDSTTGFGPPEAGTDTSTTMQGADGAADVVSTDARDGAAAIVDSLPANRERLLATYLTYLKSTPSITQSTGVSGTNVAGVCELWRKLDPSAQAVFLTLTARLQASKLTKDDSSMLGHVTILYRVAGGENATATDPGSCGGGEFNRMIMSMDAVLHDTLVVANTRMGEPNGGKPDILDAPVTAGSAWRDSHDAGGPHAPFDLSDETGNGAPRGQVQYFKDPTSAVAKAALGRTDLTTLVDPYALEMDQDYDCVHSSNPLCDYTTYGPLCAPEPTKKGTDLYATNYGDFVPTWEPADCAGK